jgi:hypothetical protein
MRQLRPQSCNFLFQRGDVLRTFDERRGLETLG